MPPAALGFEAGAGRLLLAEGFGVGAFGRVSVFGRVVVLRDGGCTCGAVLLAAFWPEEGVAFLLFAEGCRAGVVERVVAPGRVVVLRDGGCTCGAVLLAAFWPEEGVAFLLTDGLRSGVLGRVAVPGCPATSFLLR